MRADAVNLVADLLLLDYFVSLRFLNFHFEKVVLRDFLISYLKIRSEVCVVVLGAPVKSYFGVNFARVVIITHGDLILSQLG